MALTCRELVELLGEYRMEALDPESNRQAETHLLSCAQCVEYLRSYEQTICLAKRAFPSPSNDEGEVGALVQEILFARVGSRRRSWH